MARWSVCASVLAYGLHTTRVAHIVGIPKFPSPSPPVTDNNKPTRSPVVEPIEANRLIAWDPSWDPSSLILPPLPLDLFLTRYRNRVYNTVASF